MITAQRPDSEENMYTCHCGQRHDWRDGPSPCAPASELEGLWRTIHALETRIAKLEKLEQNRWNWQRARERVEEKFR